MPSRHTFLIKPVRELIGRYVEDGKGWIDPFAGENSPAEITNDLNESKPTTFHMHACDFAKMLKGEYNGVLFDPPYSLTQVKECYASIGCEDFMRDDNKTFLSRCKKSLAPLVKPGGYVICCGWNSNGFGKSLGFEMVEMLMVAHGGWHNDTIVTVERKVRTLFDI